MNVPGQIHPFQEIEGFAEGLPGAPAPAEKTPQVLPPVLQYLQSLHVVHARHFADAVQRAQADLELFQYADRPSPMKSVAFTSPRYHDCPCGLI